MQTVFYLGPEGTFSHILAGKRFRARLQRCDTLDSVVEHALHSPGSLALLPVENSSGGTVYDSIDLLIRNAPRLHVLEELALDVRIALLGRDGNDVRVVYSHFVQLKHHAGWIAKHFPKARCKALDSTALAARRAASTRGAAALASPGAADVYGLKVIARPPAAKIANVTHFYVVGEGSQHSVSAKATRTALVVTLPNHCGSLHAFLGPFARQGISLTRIVSRPVPGHPQTYVFFIEIEGHPQTPEVARALRQAAKLAASITSLGSFPSGRKFQS